MTNISINKTLSSHLSTHKVVTKSSSNNPSSFENILNQQAGGSAPSVANHPKIASTGLPDSASKEDKERALEMMEYEISHGHLDNVIMTENGYVPKACSLFSREYYAMGRSATAYYQSPEGQKSSLMFHQVAAVVHDKQGNIVAKLFKDGQSVGLATLTGGDVGGFEENALNNLEKRPNLTVTRYTDNQKVTDFDLLKDEVAHAREQIKANPEFQDTYNKMAKALHPEMTQDVGDVLAFQERILAA